METNSLRLPRLVVAGLSGDSGKTLVSLALVLAAKRQGLPVRAFKKGPDYIDAAWLAWATEHPARNLDGYMMGPERILSLFGRHAVQAGINVVEGNRGLYDGSDSQGTHSTAELAKLLRAPVVLVVNAAKVTRTLAASVLGCQKLDPGVCIAGVILNRISNRRHERVVSEAIESACGVPILGVLLKIPEAGLLPGRHLGLVTPAEHPEIEVLEAKLLEAVASRLEIETLLALARDVPPLGLPAFRDEPSSDGSGLKIGYVKDSAFTFYYPENLEALERAGATVVPVSSLAPAALPDDLDALYIGGGFPETHAVRISSNRLFLDSLGQHARNGLPIYAECGGLMVLSRSMRIEGRVHPMANVLPLDVEMCQTPQGHGYAQLLVDRPNPFFPEGLTIDGHEFHYSRILLEGAQPQTACAVKRGSGCHEGRDAATVGNVWASYTHVHAAATPQWVDGLIGAARRFRSARTAA